MKDKIAVVVFSGGMDSGTLLVDSIGRYEKVYALSIDYGQRHRKELDYARAFCEKNSIDHKVVDLSGLKDILSASSLTSDQPVPHGHYEEESMKQTVVPNRNMILISIATGYAVSIKADVLLLGVHAGDHAIYPDCRPEFIAVVSAAVQVGNYHQVTIQTPYIQMSKGEIAAVGKLLAIRYEQFWTCYAGEELACGKCGACQERIEAMAESGAIDATEYSK